MTKTKTTKTEAAAATRQITIADLQTAIHETEAKMRKRTDACCICGDPMEGKSNSAHPVDDGQCCDKCDCLVVMPMRYRDAGMAEAASIHCGADDYKIRLAMRSLRSQVADKTARVRTDASDDNTDEARIAATHNWTLIKDDDWCRCKKPADQFDNVYFRDPKSGTHGWMCPTCFHITQTG